MSASPKTDVSPKEMEELLRENTEMTKSMHRVLMGEPEYKRPGLVEIVDRHERIFMRVGGLYVAAQVAWELYKVLGLHLG